MTLYNTERILVAYEAKVDCIYESSAAIFQDILEQIGGELVSNLQKVVDALTKVDLVGTMAKAIDPLIVMARVVHKLLKIGASIIRGLTFGLGGKLAQKLLDLSPLPEILRFLHNLKLVRISGQGSADVTVDIDFEVWDNILVDITLEYENLVGNLEDIRNLQWAAAIIAWLRLIKRNLFIVFHVKKPKLRPKNLVKKLKNFGFKWLSKSVLAAGFLIFSAAMIVISYYLFEFSKPLLQTGSVDLYVKILAESKLEITADIFEDFFAALENAAPNFSVDNPNLTFLDCNQDLGDYDFDGLWWIIILAIIYILMPLFGLAITPLKRYLFHFKLFWMADKKVYCWTNLFTCCCAEKEIKEKETLAFTKSINKLLAKVYENNASRQDLQYIRLSLNKKLDDLTEAMLVEEHGGTRDSRDASNRLSLQDVKQTRDRRETVLENLEEDSD
eukprot:TRINITY_DN15930_c0_g1_i1.p1 TRINITY_DN15930_c0_g1~~TRINITY_DN15930_c0_g1_i1.p1  ORF type:complete len:483 (+),score=76.07 TRINITY_DN15930_c0_g1_i1:117-1451(+)